VGLAARGTGRTIDALVPHYEATSVPLFLPQFVVEYRTFELCQ